MKAPTQPTMVRPQPGHIRLPCRTCITWTGPLLAEARSITCPLVGFSQTLLRSGRPVLPGAADLVAVTITGLPSPSKRITEIRSSGPITRLAESA